MSDISIPAGAPGSSCGRMQSVGAEFRGPEEPWRSDGRAAHTPELRTRDAWNPITLRIRGHPVIGQAHQIRGVPWIAQRPKARASGTRLGRDVALKLLPEGFSHDPDRIARSAARRRCSPRSINRTSAPFTDSSSPAAPRRSCLISWKARRSPVVRGGGRCQIHPIGANIIGPGEEDDSEAAEMLWTRLPGADEMDAYERVLGDTMHGDATLFAREDYVEEAW